MPLTNDPEYQAELDYITARSRATSSGNFWFILIAMLAVMGLGIFLLDAFIDEHRLYLASIIGLATVCVIANMARATDNVMSALLIQTATIEWCLRKQLGEYEPLN